jgi:hypothetical protein
MFDIKKINDIPLCYLRECLTRRSRTKERKKRGEEKKKDRITRVKPDPLHAYAPT